jgi:predicted ATPase/DNA-binding SARP family transcriptional activator
MSADVRVLGPVGVVGDDGHVPLPTKHARVLAALVVAGGRSVGLDELVEAVWVGAPPASARKLVQVYVSQLRKVLPSGVGVVTRAGAYGAALDHDVLDAARFERLAGECTAAREASNPALALSLADRALSLWRGRAYGELAYEDQWRSESDRLEELRLVVVEERLDARLALGRHGEVVGEALAFADEHPFRERAHELAMLALYRSGRQSDALAHFAAARVRLQDELGLEPGPGLRDLQRRILQQDPTLDSRVTGTAAAGALPTAPNPFVGRERELEDLVRMLERREGRLVVLTGAGGSGKTRLALEAARAASGSYANGAVLVELAPVRDAGLVATTVAHALEVQAGDDDPTEALATALAALDLLLVVDNAEHLREAAPLYVELLARAPRLTLLVTSRAVLHVTGEHVFPVGPLPEDEAVELFSQRARAADRTFALSPSNEEDVREVCRRVDGLPLAIELAAARVRTLAPRALRERLDERLAVLTGGPRDLPARQQTLRETVDWSVDLLDDRARTVLGRLAVFPGGATLEAAEAVCDADLDTLAALVDDHLVLRDDTHSEARFGMLETIREYALELLGRERAEVELALAEFLARLVDDLGLSHPLRWPSAVERLYPELDNLRVALAAAAASDDGDLFLRLAGGLWRFWWVRGPATEGLEWIERALAGDAGPATAVRATALRGGAGLAWSKGDLERAKALAEAAIPVAVEVGAKEDEGSAHTVLGIVANNEGDHVRARMHHERSLQITEELGIEPVVEKLNLGVVALDAGEHHAAMELFEDVLASHRRNGRPAGIGFALLNLGLVRHVLGEHAASRRDFEEARVCFEEIGFHSHVAYALQGLAAAEASEARFAEAARLLGRARHVLDTAGTPEDAFAAELVEETKAGARAALGDEAFEAEYRGGREGG